MTKNKSEIKKTVVKKKTLTQEEKIKKFIPKKQYTIIYTIGSEPKPYIADGTDYKLSTLDIKSNQTSDTFSFPVVFVVDAVEDTLDIIPMNSIGNIRYNWGFQAEADRFMSEFEAMQKKMKEKFDQEEELAEKQTSSKKKKELMDIQYV